jgi:hypothetical protein
MSETQAPPDGALVVPEPTNAEPTHTEPTHTEPTHTEPTNQIPMWVIVLAVLVMVAAAGLVAVTVLRSDPEDTPNHPATWDARVAPYVKVVEKHRGLTFLHPVAVRFLPPAQFEKDIRSDEQDLDEEQRTEIEQTTGLMRALGLFTGKVDLFAAFNDATTSGTLAYYSFDDQRITIRGTRLGPAVRATLVHELTHALQDQQFGIGKRMEELQAAAEDGALTSEASVLVAVVEGDAERVATSYRESLPPRQRRAIAAGEQRETDRVTTELKGIPDVVGTMLSSPYVLGEAMVQAVAAEGGNSAVDRLFRDTPTHEDALLDPFTVLEDGSEAAPVDVPTLADGEEEFASGELGVLTWYFMLAERMPVRDALAAADGWGADAYVAFERDDATCARVTYRGRTGRDTSRMLAALHHWVAAAHGSPAQVSSTGRAVHFESCDPGEKSRVGKDDSADALGLVATRTYLGIGLLNAGAPEPTAHCLAGRLVEEYPVSRLQDPAFGASDPAVTARVQQLALGCR